MGAKARDCAVDHKAARDIVHFGLTYKPIPAVALKLDHKIIQYAYESLTVEISKVRHILVLLICIKSLFKRSIRKLDDLSPPLT